MNKMDCCNGDCRQGRLCPHRKTLDFTKILYINSYMSYTIGYLLLIISGISFIL